MQTNLATNGVELKEARGAIRLAMVGHQLMRRKLADTKTAQLLGKLYIII